MLSLLREKCWVTLPWNLNNETKERRWEDGGNLVVYHRSDVIVPPLKASSRRPHFILLSGENPEVVCFAFAKHIPHFLGYELSKCHSSFVRQGREGVEINFSIILWELHEENFFSHRWRCIHFARWKTYVEKLFVLVLQKWTSVSRFIREPFRLDLYRAPIVSHQCKSYCYAVV